MSSPEETLRRVRDLARRHGQFSLEAYVFVLEALNYALEQVRRKGHVGHIDGSELMLHLRDLARERFGWLARAVFEQWGVHSTLDFGRMVFQLADAELLSKQESDSLDDFRDIFPFEELEASYLD